jgi:hypothetical protein
VISSLKDIIEDFPVIEEAFIGKESGDNDLGVENRELTSNTIAFRKFLPLYPAKTIILFRYWYFDIIDNNDAGTISAS